MSFMFNLVWMNPPAEQGRPVEVAYGVNKITLPTNIEAVILFPSLMTPFVYHEKCTDPWIELLLVSNTTVTAAHVNRQLKIDLGLNAEKCGHNGWLFPGTGDNIVVESASKDGDGILKTHAKFEGVLQKLVEKRLANCGFDKFFRVRVHRAAFEMSRQLRTVRSAAEARKKKEELTEQWAKDFRPEYHDRVTKAMLEQRNVVDGYKPLPENGVYAFKVDKNGPQPWINREEPILSYHPIYFFEKDKPEHLNFGHLTDFHLNNRLEILKHTPVRVIEGGDEVQKVSKPIGELLQPTNRSFADLLNQVASAGEAHGLVIGGDLIDHQLNAWTSKKIVPTMEEIWRLVDVSDKEQGKGYVPCVDIIGFYSLLMRFCRASKKPVFGIAGNHDAYLKPFGISPRVAGMRTNAGIPADVNLTLYEAVLGFGPTFGDFAYPDQHNEAPSSFQAEWMEWFYSVFSPWQESSVQLPKQRVVCLGWGDKEDMTLGGQGATHLPRADESINPAQLTLLRNATAKHAEYKVIVISHFTVVSFREDKPMLLNCQQRNGKLEGTPAQGALQGAQDEDEYNMGTFEKNHDAFMRILSEGKITAILTGHSHRRGLYFLGEERQTLVDYKLNRVLPVTIYDPETFDWSKLSSQKKPAIIVSDSGGPYPRYNLGGELSGWGSDEPGGSIVKFAKDGRLARIDVIRAKTATPPRLAVSLDYLDVEERSSLVNDKPYSNGLVWVRPFRTNTFVVSQEAAMGRAGTREATGKPGFYELDLALRDEMKDIGLSVQTVSFFAMGAPTAALTLAVSGRRSCNIPQGTDRMFFDWLRQSESGGLFVALTFKWDHPVAEGYNVTDPWIFEVAPQRTPVRGALGSAYWELARPVRESHPKKPSTSFSYPDLPDFERRKAKAK